MGKRLPYFKFYVADFLGGVRWLTNEQTGVYIRLLCCEWESGPIPLDLGTVDQIVPGTLAAWPVLKSKFIETTAGWINERLESERQQIGNRFEKAKRGANARWKNADAMRTHNGRNADAMLRAYDYDSVSGSDSVSVESVRGVEQSAIEAELDAIAASNGSALAYTLSRDAVLTGAWGKIPRKFATERTANMPLLANAVREAQTELGLSREDAAAHVAGRIAAYCESDTGRSEYRGKLATWLKNGRWRESDDAWKRTAEEKAKPERKNLWATGKTTGGS